MFTATKLRFRTIVIGFLLISGTCQLGCKRWNAAPEKELPSVTTLLDKLNQGDFYAKLEALEDLKKHGSRAKSAVPILIKILEDDKSPIPGAAAAVKDTTITRPEDANPSIRAAAAVTLAAIGPDAKPAIPVLLLNLKDKDRFVRSASAEALARIGVKKKKIFSAFKDAMLAEKVDTTHISIAESLAELDPDSEDAISAVTKVLLKGDDPGDRSWAAGSLWRIKSSKIKEKAIPALITALEDPDADVRGSAADALGEICEESATVVPALVKRLEDQSAWVRIFAVQSLGEFGPEAKAAIPALTHAQKDPDNDVRTRIAQSLDQIRTWKKKRGQKGKQEQAKEIEKEIQALEEKLRKERIWPW